MGQGLEPYPVRKQQPTPLKEMTGGSTLGREELEQTNPIWFLKAELWPLLEASTRTIRGRKPFQITVLNEGVGKVVSHLSLQHASLCS